jgi:CRISPR-associated RAMP protein (TIGR02581 family)
MTIPPTVLEGHEVLRNRFLFRGKLVLATALRLSSGRASDLTDAPLMRDRAGVPFIPGSSLRGALRSEVERVLGGVGAAARLRSCTLFVRDDAPDACLTASRAKQEHLADLVQTGAPQAFAFLAGELCDVCRLFGSPVFASRLRIDDCRPETPSSLADKSVVRDGVGIDRDTGTARETIKFTFEVLESGPVFDFAMQAENLGPQGSSDRRLVQLVLGLLKQGLFVGGKRAAGLGRVQLKANSLKVSGFESAAALWQALTQGQDPHAPLEWKGGAA